MMVLTGMSILFASCGTGLFTEAQRRQATDTAAAKTVDAASTAFAGKWTDTPVPPTPIPPTATQPTSTPIPPTKTRTPTPTQVTAWANCIQAKLISDTIPDGAVIAPGTFFTQSWTLKNTGTCIWNKDYKLVFESGDPLTNVTEIAFPQANFYPGQEMTINVKMVAPMEEGEKLGFWKLQNKEGIRFGLGPQGDAIWMRIMVAQETTEFFRVTSALAYAVPNNFAGACGRKGYTITLYGKIKTNKAGVVEYNWVGSKGVPSKTKTLTFFGAYEQDVYDSVTYTRGINYAWARIHIVSPNNRTFGKTTFHVECRY